MKKENFLFLFQKCLPWILAPCRYKWKIEIGCSTFVSPIHLKIRFHFQKKKRRTKKIGFERYFSFFIGKMFWVERRSKLQFAIAKRIEIHHFFHHFLISLQKIWWIWEWSLKNGFPYLDMIYCGNHFSPKISKPISLRNILSKRDKKTKLLNFGNPIERKIFQFSEWIPTYLKFSMVSWILDCPRSDSWNICKPQCSQIKNTKMWNQCWTSRIACRFSNW